MRNDSLTCSLPKTCSFANSGLIMSIEAENVSKHYGRQKALDGISFRVGKGNVTGFLGPNGAGKSTMMRIITGYINASSGSVRVSGIDIAENHVEAKKKIGYLPENNPLYYDMYVREYLDFTASIFQVKEKKKQINSVIEQTGLGPEKHKKIGTLSRGFKQRVGLAQAIIHNPEVLILDEPTSGLDPNQLTDIRELVKSFGRDKTVLLSTHIMQEVEAICGHVIIINKGRIVADDSTRMLQAMQGNENCYRVEFNAPCSEGLLTRIPGVKSVLSTGENCWKITAVGTTDIRKEIFHFAVEQNLVVLSMNKEDQNLESIFQKLTHFPS